MAGHAFWRGDLYWQLDYGVCICASWHWCIRQFLDISQYYLLVLAWISDDHDEYLFQVALYIGCGCVLGYLIAIITTRVSNSDWEQIASQT